MEYFGAPSDAGPGWADFDGSVIEVLSSSTSVSLLSPTA